MANSSSYQYPNALIKGIKASWRSRTKEKLPSDPQLAELLNVTFQASLLSEESRPLSFRIAYCTPEILQNDVRNRPLVFPIPRPLSVSELVRLAPAADLTQFLLGVYETLPGQLGIWGLIDAGLSWWEYARGERLGGVPGSSPPACFTVSTAQRGCITVSREGWVICALQRGVISRPTQQVFSSGPFKRYLTPMTIGMSRH